MIGAGNYATRALISAFQRAGAKKLQSLVSDAGVSVAHYGRKFDFRTASTSVSEAIEAPDCRAVVIASRHDSHATYVCEALAAGKDVFEKPMCIRLDDFDQMRLALGCAHQASGENRPILMVGFNRRFAPQVVTMKRLFSSAQGPMDIVITANAGGYPLITGRTIQRREVVGSSVRPATSLTWLATRVTRRSSRSSALGFLM